MTLLGTGWQGRIFSSGWIPGAGGEYDAVEPATGNTLARVGAAAPEDVAKAAAAAREAQREWAAQPYDQRARVLRRAARLFEDHGDEIDEWLIRESGATRGFAQFQTRAVAAEECHEAAALAAHPYGELLRSSRPRLSMARRVPAGVVGVISPFNAPIILSIRAIAPALALGNAVLAKPDPRTAVCGGVVLARIFEEAGLPEGLFHLLPGGADVGAALVEDPLVRVIAFTGSTNAGRKIAAAAGERL
ncbi:aldehyde dehydrogenase family protein, partial [Amycolatopsis sp. NPDC000673]